MWTNSTSTTVIEDRKGIDLLEAALAEARAVGEGEVPEEDYPTAVDLWRDLMEVIGVKV